MTLQSLIRRARALSAPVATRSRTIWRKYRGLRPWKQWLIALVLLALLIGGITFARSGGKDATLQTGRTVTLASVGELSGTGSSVDFIGTVRSVAEANILAQTGGTVRAVNTAIGRSVPAGSIIAQLENASERASVLQAEGSYDAAIAARSGQSLPDTETAARNAYRNAYVSVDTTVENYIDTFFGEPTAVGPKLLIYPGLDETNALSRERTRIGTMMNEWEASLATADRRDPQTLLNDAEAKTRDVEVFLTRLAAAANKSDSRATADQLAALASARSSISGVLSSIATARGTLRTGSTSATAGADASVKQALGSLRAAQANLEKTIVRAPIGGQINFLSIRVGDYVTAFTHVATVAQNGALEIVVFVPENDRNLLVAGGKVTVDAKYDGVITSVAPALDPKTKQIEVHVAVTGTSELVNGQSVHISFPDLEQKEPAAEAAQGPILLPLSAVKLRTGDRIIFTVGEDGRLVARAVEVGDVRGDRIEILTELAPELRIVKDARGLSEGEKVTVAEAIR